MDTGAWLRGLTEPLRLYQVLPEDQGPAAAAFDGGRSCLALLSYIDLPPPPGKIALWQIFNINSLPSATPAPATGYIPDNLAGHTGRVIQSLKTIRVPDIAAFTCACPQMRQSPSWGWAGMSW